MIDVFLRADTEADLAAALPQLRGFDDAGNPCWLIASEEYALDLIGPVITTPGEYAEDGTELVEPVLDQRFHANLRCTPEMAGQVPMTVRIPAPATPLRVWA